MYSTLSNDGFVYFLQYEVGGPIKIGSATNVQERIKQIQPGNPKKLNLLHATTGGKRLEFYLHERFSGTRVFGEWFNESPSLVEFIEKLRSTDDEHGKVLSIGDFLQKYDDEISETDIYNLREISNGSIISSVIGIDNKIKYWKIIDDYLSYQRLFPSEMISDRNMVCFINEGRQSSDRDIRKEQGVTLKYV